MSDETPPNNWAADVKRYVPDADDGVIAKIVNYCGIALRTRDASLVSFTDQTETDRVRENFCKKKLAIEEPDEVLDAAIAKVGERMSDTSFRNRVTVYYLLAEHFDRLGVFGGAQAGANAAPLAAAAPSAAAIANAAAPAGITAEATTAPHMLTAATGAGVGPGSGGGGFLGLAGVMFVGAATIMLVSAIAGSFVGGRFDKAEPAPAPAPAPVAAPAPAPVPDGAGIVSEVVDGRPKVSVYFDVGKNEIAPEFAAAVAPVKAWLDANPADRVQLSGFTDPTGNAGANAELAKRRAQAVSAALADRGVAAERIDLVKPADTSDETTDMAGARRVEITVTPG